MKRKGDTLNTVLGIILAVIGILIFIAGIYKLYQVGVNEESENAKKTLDIVIARVNAMPDGETGKFTLQGFSQDVWYIVGWGRLDRESPEKCLGSACLCICKKSGFASGCQGSDGFCRVIDFDNVSVRSAYQRGSLSGVNPGGLAGVPSPSTPNPRVLLACLPVLRSFQEISISTIMDTSLIITGEDIYEDYLEKDFDVSDTFFNENNPLSECVQIQGDSP